MSDRAGEEAGDGAGVPARYAVALLGHVLAKPVLLRLWRAQLDFPWPFPLVVYGHGYGASEGEELLRASVEAADVDLELGTDLLFIPSDVPEAEVAARATGVFRSAEQRHDGPLGEVHGRADAWIQACRHRVITEALATDPPPGPPDFVGIGTQRGGTTWWAALLADHPEVEVSWKELHFFDAMPDLPLEMYARVFRRPPGGLAGEFTPEYMFDPTIPPLIHRVVPGTKIIVILRDPVTRYRSGLAHDADRGTRRIAQLFARLLEIDGASPEDVDGGITAVWTPEEVADATRLLDEHFRRGLYSAQLENVLEVFPREQVLVLQYERCVADPLAEYRRTLAFLEVRDLEFVPPSLAARVNVGRERLVLDPPTRRDLEAAYAEDVERLVELVPDIDPSLWPTVSPSARHPTQRSVVGRSSA